MERPHTAAHRACTSEAGGRASLCIPLLRACAVRCFLEVEVADRIPAAPLMKRAPSPLTHLELGVLRLDPLLVNCGCRGRMLRAGCWLTADG